MTQVIEHETAKPASAMTTTKNVVVPMVGASVLTVVATNEAAREAVLEGGKAVINAIADNPKIAFGLAGLATLAYGIKRVTEPGVTLRIGSFLKIKRE
ncbi:MAG: hypothetical protein KJ989_03720 [Gammaproteobacteria bacterium]|uniref:hypothetical protein n=1 Tax=Pseudomonas sp. GLN_6 TaxID=3367183 RepID=UPI001D5E5828|nr:hypothetical protein [Gammaproteobacteria bacterium]MBU2154694.1 hypothetical protein [Gammaproteobacteria bacterium]MBU2257204.1 hypothetical protein [Gammaproteobacteria bacterium]MBU2293296.1 hypothetical protein [Gammaproteobacteria bacterium]